MGLRKALLGLGLTALACSQAAGPPARPTDSTAEVDSPLRAANDAPLGTFKLRPDPGPEGILNLGVGEELTVNATAFTDPDGDSLKLKVNWGDGTSDRAPCGPCRLSHRYGPGRYVLSAQVSDLRVVDGGTTTRTWSVQVAGAGPTVTPPSPLPSDEPLPVLVITVVGMFGDGSFSPNPAVAVAGQRVRWQNADAFSHTATADAGAFDTGSIPGGTSATITAGPPGTFDYHCSFHPSMVGTLIVNPAP
jgi:plastocyanin